VFRVAALAMAGGAAAKEIRCDVDSDYDLGVTPRSVVLTRKDGTPKAIVMRQGRLFVDDQWVSLSADDSKRIAEYEKKVRAAMPLAAQIGRDAADIAFTALGEVASGLSSDPPDARPPGQGAHADRARLARRSGQIVSTATISAMALPRRSARSCRS
jgi:hypothetical protein